MPSDPFTTVEAFFDAVIDNDLGAALERLADDCEYTNIPLMTVTGRKGAREVLEPFFAPIHENEIVILRSAAEGKVVFLERLDRHRLDHGWRELPVNSVFEVEDGRITVWRDYFDSATAAAIHNPNG